MCVSPSRSRQAGVQPSIASFGGNGGVAEFTVILLVRLGERMVDQVVGVGNLRPNRDQHQSQKAGAL